MAAHTYIAHLWQYPPHPSGLRELARMWEFHLGYF